MLLLCSTSIRNRLRCTIYCCYITVHESDDLSSEDDEVSSDDESSDDELQVQVERSCCGSSRCNIRCIISSVASSAIINIAFFLVSSSHFVTKK